MQTQTTVKSPSRPRGNGNGNGNGHSNGNGHGNGRGSVALAQKQPWLRLLPEDGWLTIALLVVMVYTTVASIQSVTPPWAPGLQILTATTGMGLLLGYLSVQQGRLPSGLVQLVAMAIGVWFAFVQTADAVVGGDRGMLLGRTGEWFHKAVLLHQSSDDNAVFLLFLGILSFLLAFISVWLVLHTRRPWLAALANGVVLLINLNWADDSKTLFFLVLFLLATLLLLVRFTLAENIRQWRAKGLRFSPDLGWDFMQAGAIFAVIVLLAAYLLPAGNANQVISDWWNSPTNPWQQLQQHFETAFGGVQGNGPGSLDFFGADLQLVGSVNLPNVEILRYTASANNDPSQYLITRTLNIYNGTNHWSAAQTQVNQYPPGQTQPSSVSSHVGADTYKITIVREPGGSPLFAPGTEARSFSVPSESYASVDSQTPMAWVAAQPPVSGDTYTATGYVSTATKAQLQAVPYPGQISDQSQRDAQYPPVILTENLSNLPSNLPPEVEQLARQWTQGASNMYDAAEAIENHLRADFKYTTKIENPPQGVDAISWFLQRKEGFCTYFATTMAMMARSLGMPVRIAEGFSNGAYDSKTNSYIVKGTQAHVWPQIYFGQYGWINFEPTASFTPFSRAFDGNGNGAGSVTTPGANGGATTPSTTKQRQQELTGGGGRQVGIGNGASPVLVGAGISASLLIVLILLALALFALWWRMLYRGLTPVAAAFARVAHLGAWAGAQPKRSQTPAEYADQLARVIPGQRPTLERLGEIYSRERYGGGAPQEAANELPHLYEQVRTSVTPVIVRRLRHVPAALLARGRRLRRVLRGRQYDE